MTPTQIEALFAGKRVKERPCACHEEEHDPTNPDCGCFQNRIMPCAHRLSEVSR